MAKQEFDLDPVDWITIDAIGQPGARTFYIQGKKVDTTITVILEKIQVQTLCVGVEQFLVEVAQKFSGLAPFDSAFTEEQMHIQPPVDPIFRAGEIGLSYDSEEDKAIIVIREILTNQSSEEEISEVRFWCSRDQLAAVSKWGVELTSRGRPICPQCGEPMDPAGHLCPKKNGHKK
jgi:uncharacterized repeat protein (TIGR03847 family)